MIPPRESCGATGSRRDAVRDAGGGTDGQALAVGVGENVAGRWTEQHLMLRRVRRVSTLVLELWGDAPPPPPEPAVTAAHDALAADDGFGRAEHLVVQGDRLTYQQLVRVLALIEDPDRLSRALTMLPPRLRERLVDDDLLGSRPDPE